MNSTVCMTECVCDILDLFDNEAVVNVNKSPLVCLLGEGLCEGLSVGLCVTYCWLRVRVRTGVCVCLCCDIVD